MHKSINLETFPYIWSSIFCNLSAKDIITCTKVNKEWQQFIQKTLFKNEKVLAQFKGKLSHYNWTYNKPQELEQVKTILPDGVKVEIETDLNGNYIVVYPRWIKRKKSDNVVIYDKNMEVVAKIHLEVMKV